MLTKREQLLEALQNMATGTSKAAELKRNATNPEVRELADALHFVGYGAQQIVLALTDRGRIDDL